MISLVSLFIQSNLLRLVSNSCFDQGIFIQKAEGINIRRSPCRKFFQECLNPIDTMVQVVNKF